MDKKERYKKYHCGLVCLQFEIERDPTCGANKIANEMGIGGGNNMSTLKNLGIIENRTGDDSKGRSDWHWIGPDASMELAKTFVDAASELSKVATNKARVKRETESAEADKQAVIDTMTNGDVCQRLDILIECQRELNRTILDLMTTPKRPLSSVKT